METVENAGRSGSERSVISPVTSSAPGAVERIVRRAVALALEPFEPDLQRRETIAEACTMAALQGFEPAE